MNKGCKSETGPPGAPPVDPPSGLSRRDFIRLNSALLLATGLGSCSIENDRSDLRSTLHVLRSADLLSLQFELHNLQIVHRLGKPSRLRRISDSEDAFITVRFPGQHIAEQTYTERTDPRASEVLPAVSLIARPSRLVFRIPRATLSVELSLESLLNWGRWEPVYMHEAENRLQPGALQTQIEAPRGIALSPGPSAAWVHAIRPVTFAGRTELWHTRLAGDAAHAGSQLRILNPGYSPGETFEGSLTPEDRRMLIGQSTTARTLILSPQGGWLDLRGQWERGEISRWEHRVTAGQDQRVVIQRRDGFLYPFGHRATLMTVTERELSASSESGATTALLRKRDFIVIKERQKTFAHALMCLESMTAQALVTPTLCLTDRSATTLWVETQPGIPYRFPFAARDWADGGLEFDAPAVFVSATGTAGEAQDRYEEDRYTLQRVSTLSGQSASVARFQDPQHQRSDRWGEPLAKRRSAGDTSLRLLSLGFTANPALSSQGAPFSCVTEAMEARVPALEQFLDDATNVGWFQRRDPEPAENLGEIFAQRLQKGDAGIPLYFDQQSDRCGGLGMPSLTVDGLSRVLGPVGDADSLSAGNTLDWNKYLDADRAWLLGRFKLTDLLGKADGTRSKWVPRINFAVRQIPIKPEKKPEPVPDPTPENRAETDSDPQEKSPGTYREVEVALAWTVPIDTGIDLVAISIEPRRDKDNKSLMKLDIAAGATKSFGKPASKDTQAANTASISFSAQASLKNFELGLLPRSDAAPWIIVGVDYLQVAIGPPEPKKEKEEKDPKDAPEPEGEKKKSAASISVKVELGISSIEATGSLRYVQKLFDRLPHIPEVPDLPAYSGNPGNSERSYPAKLPELGKADVNLKLGPFSAPDFKWLQLEVSNAAVSFGLGFYFMPRLQKDGTSRIPDPEFALRLAEPSKPLTLIANHLGGIAHLGMNFTTGGMTALQASLGVLYRPELDLKVSKAKCEGSLAGVFTYLADDPDGEVQVDLVLKLSGSATLYIAEVYLQIVAVGKWAQEQFVFGAQVQLRITISFFTLALRFSFETQSGDSSEPDRLTSQSPAAVEVEQLSEREWSAYRAAFSTHQAA